jgi:hypothetical protein
LPQAKVRGIGLKRVLGFMTNVAAVQVREDKEHATGPSGFRAGGGAPFHLCSV